MSYEARIKYWRECIEIEAEECGLEMTAEQLDNLAAAVSNGYENYDQAFYRPPSSDRMGDIEREWKTKIKWAEEEFEAYRRDAETAVKQALGRRHDDKVIIDGDGEVRLIDGRSDRIQ
jgi:hypothetical protein